MQFRSKWWIFLSLPLAATLFCLFCTTGIMRESDQASLISGAWRIYQSGHFGGNYYNYDKQFGTYWLLAAAFRARSLFGGHWSPVLVADLVTGSAFWCAACIAFLKLSRRRRIPSLLALSCFLATPAILINTVYANAAILSAGFVIIAGALLGESIWLAAACFFVAVAMRADAVLLAPLLVWLVTPSGRPWRIVTGLPTRLLAVAALSAIALGATLYTGRKQFGDIFDPIFHAVASKTIPVYIAFGMGPSIILGILFFSGLLASMSEARSRRKVFYGSGALCLAIPFLYYSVQLYSPRYLITSTLAVFLFASSRRGTAFRMVTGWRPSIMAVRSVALAAAVVPLLIGIRLPSISSPRLAFSNPTLYPTTDGLHPLGAYGGFLLTMRDFDRREIDHNQLVWKSAAGAYYEPSPDGAVHILNTPMDAYLKLAVTLDGLKFKGEELTNGDSGGLVMYADSRTFMRAGSSVVSGAFRRLLDVPSSFVSPQYSGIGIVRFNGGGDLQWANETLLLNRIFQANDYRLLSLGSAIEPDGRRFALISPEPFRFHGENAGFDARSGLYFATPVAISGISAQHPGLVSLAVQALPSWMSVAQ